MRITSIQLETRDRPKADTVAQVLGLLDECAGQRHRLAAGALADRLLFLCGAYATDAEPSWIGRWFKHCGARRANCACISWPAVL